MKPGTWFYRITTHAFELWQHGDDGRDHLVGTINSITSATYIVEVLNREPPELAYNRGYADGQAHSGN